MEVDEGPNQNIRHTAPLDACSCALKDWFTEDEKYHNVMKWLKYAKKKADSRTNEPVHDKTDKMICAPSEDSDQPGYPHILI